MPAAHVSHAQAFPALPTAGTNCHRSCYTLDLAKALPLKQSCDSEGLEGLGRLVEGSQQ